jgi:hypothetical protein
VRGFLGGPPLREAVEDLREKYEETKGPTGCEVSRTSSETSEVSVFKHVRNELLSRYPDLGKLVAQRFPGDGGCDEALAYTLELFLRTVPNLHIAVDGWKMFRVASETASSLRVIGIMHVLPSGNLPVEVTLSTDAAATQYRVLTGVADSRWESLSDAQQWKAVYLYASGEREETWTWASPILGIV